MCPPPLPPQHVQDIQETSGLSCDTCTPRPEPPVLCGSPPEGTTVWKPVLERALGRKEAVKVSELSAPFFKKTTFSLSLLLLSVQGSELRSRGLLVHVLKVVCWEQERRQDTFRRYWVDPAFTRIDSSTFPRTPKSWLPSWQQ